MELFSFAPLDSEQLEIPQTKSCILLAGKVRCHQTKEGEWTEKCMKFAKT